MEDQKKTDIIKNMRTVLPPLTLKNSEETEKPLKAPAAEDPHASSAAPHKTARSPLIASPSPAPAQIPEKPQEKLLQMHPQPRHPSAPPQAPSYEYRQPEQRQMDARQSSMYQQNVYKVHPSGAYPPHTPYGKISMGYPPGRQPPHTQTRYYPPVKQYSYMGEMHPPRPMEHPRPMEKKLSSAPPAILMPDVGGSTKIQIKDAMRYLDIVKEEYKDNKDVYNRFLKTMKEYKDKQIDVKSVIEIILVLFNGNQKLIQGFNQFLPKKYEILPSGEIKIHEMEKQQRKEPYEDRRRDEDRRREEERRREPAHTFSQEPPQKPLHSEVKSDLEGAGIGIKQREPRGDIDDTARVVMYLNKVRKHLENNPVAWFEFLRIVQSYKNNRDQRPIPELLANIKVLLKDDPSLIEEFMIFLPSSPASEPPRMRSLHRTHPGNTMGMLNDIRGILTQKGVYVEFLKALNMFNQGLLSSSSLLLVIEPFLRPIPALFSLFKYYIGHRESEMPPHIQSSLEIYKKVGSYRVLPEKYRKSRHSGQTPEDASVLNTGYISCPTFSSESSTFIFAKKNIHEEALFRVEDERYEADLLIERISSLALKLMEYKALAVNDANYPKELPSPSHKLSLSDIDKEIISIVYGSSSDDIILGLIAHPIRAIPVVLKQIRNIETQWMRIRASCSDLWRSTVDKNYIKALDVKGYRVRNGERKIALVKQFVKDIESAKTVSFCLPHAGIIKRTVEILLQSMESEEDDSVVKTLELLESLLTTESVFPVTQDIYYVLRGIASLCSRISAAIQGKRIRPEGNKIAEELGVQKERENLSEEDIFELIEECVLGNIDNTKFEEKLLGALGLSGTSLVGVLGVFQNVESMIEGLSESKSSQDMLHRLSNKSSIPETNLSELIIRGISIVKIEVVQKKDGFSATAEKISLQNGRSTKWLDYVKNFNVSVPAAEHTPFLQRSLSGEKRKMEVSYGMEYLFSGEKFKLKQVPGTEDFVAKKKQKLSNPEESLSAHQDPEEPHVE